MSRGGVGRAGGGGRRGGEGRARGGGVPITTALPLPEVDLGVPLALIAAGKLASTLAAGKGLFARVRADMRGQVVTAAEIAHADAALERLLACVHAHVSCQLIRAREAALAALSRAGVRPLLRRSLALPHHTGLPGPARLGQVTGIALTGGSLDLRGEGFDCGQRCERQGRGVEPLLLVQLISKLLVLLRLWKQVVWDRGHHH